MKGKRLYLDTNNEFAGNSFVAGRQVLQAYRQFGREFLLLPLGFLLILLHQILQRNTRQWINKAARSRLIKMKISMVNGAHQGGRSIGATELSVVGIPGIGLDRAGVLVDRTCAKIDRRVVSQVERRRRRSRRRRRRGKNRTTD